MVYLAAHGPVRPENQAEPCRRDAGLDSLTVRVRQAAPELTMGRGKASRWRAANPVARRIAGISGFYKTG
ncbi:hypothetical protein P3T39_004273 [Kitasatospora sp. GP82]|nr:hypothetical protein [Kitasatospora sp. GP82]